MEMKRAIPFIIVFVLATPTSFSGFTDSGKDEIHTEIEFITMYMAISARTGIR